MKTIRRPLVVALMLSLLAVVGSRGDEPREPSPAGDGEIPASVLAWDQTEKEQTLRDGETIAAFDFTMKNGSPAEVEVQKINVSCGCTSLAGRETPFKLKPGESETLRVRMNVAGKIGEVTKTVYVMTDHGAKTLLVTAKIIPPDTATVTTMREQNLAFAKANRQAVFQGDCAACHARPADAKQGLELYQNACAICHDAEHRAAIVPDLRVPKEGRDAAWWRAHITDGREGTLMPAFAKEKGGILSDAQIESLVKFLTETPIAPILGNP